MRISFTYDDNCYTAECETQDGYYVVENIRIDFLDGVADIPIKSMKIHCVDCNQELLWMDEHGNSNLLINTLGNVITTNFGKALTMIKTNE